MKQITTITSNSAKAAPALDKFQSKPSGVKNDNKVPLTFIVFTTEEVECAGVFVCGM